MGKAVSEMFHNWPPDSTRRMSRPKRPCTLSMAQLDERIRELHARRHELLDLAMKRDLTPGELRLARHILHELDWYEMRQAEPAFRAHDENMRAVRSLVRRVKRLQERCGC